MPGLEPPPPDDAVAAAASSVGGPRGPGPADRRDELGALDLAVYGVVAVTATPKLDRDLARLSRAADRSKLWLAVAGVLAVAGGERGRRAAVTGLSSIAVTSTIVNLVLKPLGGRRRPDRERHRVPLARQVSMPRSTSFPSGHAASAFAFASGASGALPVAGMPLHAAAALVAYSRVHTGVHYPADVIVGSLVGAGLAPLTPFVVARASRLAGRAGVMRPTASRSAAWRGRRPGRRRTRASGRRRS
jgi:membrane-associated phospholipid phosphatase